MLVSGEGAAFFPRSVAVPTARDAPPSLIKRSWTVCRVPGSGWGAGGAADNRTARVPALMEPSPHFLLLVGLSWPAAGVRAGHAPSAGASGRGAMVLGSGARAVPRGHPLYPPRIAVAMEPSVLPASCLSYQHLEWVELAMVGHGDLESPVFQWGAAGRDILPSRSEHSALQIASCVRGCRCERPLAHVAGPPWEVAERGGKCLVLETGRPGFEPQAGRSGTGLLAGISATINWGACENLWNVHTFPAESTWVAGDNICPPSLLLAPRPCNASSPTCHLGLFAVKNE